MQLAHAEKVTHAMVMPNMLDQILTILGTTAAQLPHLRALSYGGGRMPLSGIKRALRIMPLVDFVNADGPAETSSTIALLGPEDHRDAISSDDAKVRPRLGSVNHPLPILELKIGGPGGARSQSGGRDLIPR